MRSLSRPVRKKLILIYFTAWNVSKQRINKKQHHPIHLQMPFPPPVSKTMGRWSLPVLVDLLKTWATAAFVTDLCAFRWRVICLRRAECFTKLMNTTLATTERNYSTKWVTLVLILIWGLAGSIREVTQSPLQSFPVKLEHELGGAMPRRVSRKDYPLYGMYGNPGMFPCEIQSTGKFYSSRNPESHWRLQSRSMFHSGAD